MSLKPSLSICLCQQEQRDIPFVVTEESGSPFSLVGLRLFFTVKTAPSSAVVEIFKISTVITELEITDAAGGEFTVKILTADTDREARLYTYDVAYDNGAGLDRTVIVKNQTFCIEQSSTEWPA